MNYKPPVSRDYPTAKDIEYERMEYERMKSR